MVTKRKNIYANIEIIEENMHISIYKIKISINRNLQCKDTTLQ